ncbi:MAG TPA: GNAT family N-acetyltransferase [Azospirillaceae bacterium]|nr:GNAT family N-acetyltransferase [Azospirillaceae bacterium]
MADTLSADTLTGDMLTGDTLAITVEHGADLHTPASKAVLAGLGAYNAAKTPPVRARIGVAARDSATDAWLGGITATVYGNAAYAPWGVWTEEAADGAVGAAILAAAEAALAGLGCVRLTAGGRAHAPLSPYGARGFRTTHAIPDHIRGGDYVVLRKELAGAAAPEVPAGVSLELRTPPSDPWTAENWRRLDARRQRNFGVAPRWVSAYVRDGGAVRGGALCYAVADEFMVDMLWLDEPLRGTGTGARMMRAALDAGRALGCRRATVETADFQAPDFYRRIGFSDLAYVPDMLSGAGMTALRMDL